MVALGRPGWEVQTPPTEVEAWRSVEREMAFDYQGVENLETWGGHWQNFRKSRARKYRVDFIQDM